MMVQSKQLFQYGREIVTYWWRVLRLIWNINAPFVMILLGLTLLMGIVPALQIQVISLLVGCAADAIRHQSGWHFLLPALLWGMAMGGISLLLVLAEIVQQYIQNLLQISTANHMNVLIMEKALTLDLQHYEDDKLYDSLQRASSESAYRPYQFFLQFTTFGMQLISLVAICIVLLAWNWLIALIILCSTLPIAGSQIIFSKRRYQLEWARSPEWRHLSYLLYLTTHAQSFKEVQIFQLGTFFLQRNYDLYDRFYKADKTLATQRTQVDGLLGLLRIMVIAGIQLYIITTTIGLGNIGMLAGYLQATTALQSSTTGIFEGLGQLYQSCLYLNNLFEFLDTPASRLKSGNRTFPRQIQTGIEFRHVSFRYPGATEMVLSDVSFHLPASACVALVGHNGAGKTTIMKLLARLYEPTEGQIFIDEIPIEEYDLDDLKRHISVIFQDFMHYEMSVRENIGFGNLDQIHSEKHITQAASAANAAQTIAQLPQQYDTQLGRSFAQGHELSIGQWQKIALARAFMRNAAILILDEPTASIDAATEAEIFARLREIAQGSTTLLIAHRFSTVRMADKIVVLEQGKVIEEGTHELLISKQGTYAHLFNLQAAGYL